MPDFCECWVRIFKNISSLFGVRFAVTHLHPILTRHLNLFSKAEHGGDLNREGLQTLLTCCYLCGTIAPMVSDSHCRQYYSIALREVLLNTNCHRSASFELAVEFLLDEEWNGLGKEQKILNDSTIGVLWEGVTHQSAAIRKVTGRALTSAARKLSIVEISRQLFPALNSIAQDDQSEVRVEASNTLAVISQRMLADPDDDLDKRLQKLILQVFNTPPFRCPIAVRFGINSVC